MEIRLSKDATKISKLIYKEFRKTRNKIYDNSFIDRKDFNISTDITDILDELEQHNLIKTYIDYSFELKNEFTIFMENRLKDKVIDAVDVGTKFIP